MESFYCSDLEVNPQSFPVGTRDRIVNAEFVFVPFGGPDTGASSHLEEETAGEVWLHL